MTQDQRQQIADLDVQVAALETQVGELQYALGGVLYALRALIPPRPRDPRSNLRLVRSS